jgi:hypothetical protein
MTERDAFLAVARAHRPEDPVSVPAGVLIALLSGTADAPAPSAGVLPSADLGVGELAARYQRRPSTIRAWLERGLFPGAFKLRGRDWRAPASAVAAFDEAERRGSGEAAQPTAQVRRRPVNLSAWRDARSAS